MGKGKGMCKEGRWGWGHGKGKGKEGKARARKGRRNGRKAKGIRHKNCIRWHAWQAW